MTHEELTMKEKILVTDSLFIFEEHVQQIEDAGYEVVRIDDPGDPDDPIGSEDRVVEAVKGMTGYILGGTEVVTDRVIEAADKLKVVSFTGAGYTEFVPGYAKAKDKGIAVTAAKGGNAPAVAEFTIALVLMSTRRISELTNPDGAKFLTTKGASESTLGVIGYGDIGGRVAKMASSLGYSVLVSARKKIEGLPSNIRQVDLSTLVTESDVVSLHVDKKNGTNVLSAEMVASMKSGAAIVNAAFIHAIDQNAVAKRIEAGELRLLSDQKLEVEGNFPVGSVVQTNLQSGFNTYQALKAVSDQTTNSLLNILETGEDDFRVV